MAERRPPLYRELSRKQRIFRAALTAFTLYHLLAMVVGGATKPIKRTFAYVFGFYDEGMRMTNSWGMFGKPPGATHVIVEGDTKDGRTIVLTTTNAKGRTFSERVRDVRIRKLQGKLTDVGDRMRWGNPFLDYLCRDAKERGIELKHVRVVNQIHELKNDDGKPTRAASRSVVMSKGCASGAPPAFMAPAPKPGADGDEGGL